MTFVAPASSGRLSQRERSLPPRLPGPVLRTLHRTFCRVFRLPPRLLGAVFRGAPAFFRAAFGRPPAFLRILLRRVPALFRAFLCAPAGIFCRIFGVPPRRPHVLSRCLRGSLQRYRVRNQHQCRPEDRRHQLPCSSHSEGMGWPHPRTELCRAQRNPSALAATRSVRPCLDLESSYRL